MLPMVPVAFPVPSYASERVPRRDGALVPGGGGRARRACAGPTAPSSSCRSTTRARSTSATASYDQDYHPDAMAAFREFLRAKYRRKRDRAPGRVGRRRRSTFASVEPPRRFDAHETRRARRATSTGPSSTSTCCRRAMERMAAALADAGARRLPTTHNLPLGESATPLNPARMTAIDLVGPRLLPPGHAHRALGHPAPHDRARVPVRGARRSGVRRGGGGGLPAVLRAARRARLDVRAHVRDGVRAPRVQPLHGRRARPVDRRAHRSARPTAPARRASTRACSRRWRARGSTRCAGGRPCASSSRGRSAASRARRTRSARSRPRSSTSSARAGARACSSETSGSTRLRSWRPRRTCAPSSARSTRAACRSLTPAARPWSSRRRGPSGSCARVRAD